MRRLGLTLTAAISIACPAQAAPARSSLTVAPPPSSQCADRAQLVAAVATRLGRDPFVEHGADIAVSVRYEKRERWEALVTLTRVGGRQIGAREISTESPTCAGLHDPVALVVALLVDVSRDELPAQTPEAHPEPQPAPPKALRIPAPRSSRPGLSVLWSLSASSALGLLPDAGFGGQIGIWLEPSEYFALGITATYWFEQRSQLEDRPAGVEMRADGLSAELCGPRLALDALWLRPCVVQRFSRLSASAFGFDVSGQQTRSAAGTGLGGQLFLPVSGPVGLFGSASAEAQWIRDRFVYVRSDGTRGELHRSAPIVGFFQVGVGFSL